METNPTTTTPESTASTTELTDAGLQSRAIAYIIDIAAVIAFIIGIGILSLILGKISAPLGGIVYLLGMIASIAYTFLRDGLPFLNGTSIGKKVMKIQAVTLTGASLSGNYKASILRNLPLLIAIVEVIIIIVKKDENPLQRLGDQLAKTRVIKTA